MTILSDAATIFKISVFFLIVGFVLGLWSAGGLREPAAISPPAPAATSSSAVTA